MSRRDAGAPSNKSQYRYPSATGRLFDPPDGPQLQQDVDELADLLQEAWRFLARDEQDPQQE